MPKVALKKKIAQVQQEACNISGEKLSEETKLFDTHRAIPKRKGGTYTKENTAVVIPIHHMQEHDTLRIRTQQLEQLKMIIDDRSQIMKLKNKLNNQLLAYERKTDMLNEETRDWLIEQRDLVKKKLGQIDRKLTKFVTSMDNELAQTALRVRGIGPITIAYCLAYIELDGIFPEGHPRAGQEKTRHASSLWKYTGLHCSSHERYSKGESSGGNKTLRTVLYTMADSQIKVRGLYREVYDRVKTRLEKSDKIVKSRNTQGQLVEVAWKDTKPSHRHGAALRAVMKHFLADYWFVGRTLAGLETSMLYPEAVLGSGHRTILPDERGWIY